MLKIYHVIKWEPDLKPYYSLLLDQAASLDLFQDLYDPGLRIPCLLHCRSPLLHIMQENSNCQWYDFKGALRQQVNITKC